MSADFRLSILLLSLPNEHYRKRLHVNPPTLLQEVTRTYICVWVSRQIDLYGSRTSIHISLQLSLQESFRDHAKRVLLRVTIRVCGDSRPLLVVVTTDERRIMVMWMMVMSASLWCMNQGESLHRPAAPWRKFEGRLAARWYRAWRVLQPSTVSEGQNWQLSYRELHFCFWPWQQSYFFLKTCLMSLFQS